MTTGGALGGVFGSSNTTGSRFWFNWYSVTSVSFSTELFKHMEESAEPFPAQLSGSLINVRISLRTSLNDTHLPTLFFSSSRTTLSLEAAAAFGVLVRMVILGSPRLRSGGTSEGEVAAVGADGADDLVVAAGGACGHTT